jgi:transcriptional regulator with XRE-family HTH domain
MTYEPLRRRLSVGTCLRIWRARRDLSIETVAERAGISHVTYRRVEAGRSVRDSTYTALEDFLELPPGTIIRALVADDAVMELSRALGSSLPTEELPLRQLINYLRRASWRTPTEDAALEALSAWDAELGVAQSGDVPVDSLRKL